MLDFGNFKVFNFKIYRHEKKESPLVEKLIREMQLRNYSPSSILTYSTQLAKLETDLNLSLDLITTQQFKDYLHQRVVREKISTSLINQTIGAYKIFQVDVMGREWEQFKVRRPRREKKLPTILSLGEIEKLISITQNIKHRALLSLAYSTGMRRQEIQLIKPVDVDSARMQVKVVQGKGKKDRFTILSPKALELLRSYYKIQRPKVFLFESQGKPGVKLADTTLNAIVKHSAAKAGIKKRVSFHTLRHCFATHLLEQGVNIRLIQEFLGHVSLKTTAIYLQLVNVEPSNVKSPLDSMDI